MEKEGLVVFHPTPQPTTIDYPMMPSVADPYALRIARIRSLVIILHKHMELSKNILLALSRVRDPQMRQLLEFNYRHEMMEMEQLWKAIKSEIAELN